MFMLQTTSQQESSYHTHATKMTTEKRTYEWTAASVELKRAPRAKIAETFIANRMGCERWWEKREGGRLIKRRGEETRRGKGADALSFLFQSVI